MIEASCKAWLSTSDSKCMSVLLLETINPYASINCVQQSFWEALQGKGMTFETLQVVQFTFSELKVDYILQINFIPNMKGYL